MITTEPVVELDARFSAPGASATPWVEVRRVIQEAELFWISTVRPDGRPHVTPLPAVWRDGALYFCTGAGEQKGVNLERNPNCILTTGNNASKSGLDVVIEGTAARVTDNALLQALAEAWDSKYQGDWHFDVANGAFQHDGGEALVFELAPAKALAFAKGDFAQTRFRFPSPSTWRLRDRHTGAPRLDALGARRRSLRRGPSHICQPVGVAQSVLLVGWAGGGNVPPLLCLAQEMADQGVRVAVLPGRGLSGRVKGTPASILPETAGWLPGADDVLSAVEQWDPDGLVVDYMLTDALCGAEASGKPTATLVHTLYRALLVDGAPHPMGMAGPVDALNQTRARLRLRPIQGHADLLAASALVSVAAPRELDAPGEVPANVRYLGPLIPRSPSGVDWRAPEGSGPLVAVSLGTAATVENEAEIIQRILGALGTMSVRGLVNLPDHISPNALIAPSNVALAGYIPHQAVLRHTSVLVTHAGLGSVMAALANAVPMVCIPLGREQPENAAATSRIGRGVLLSPDAEPDAIVGAIADALSLGPGTPIRTDPASAARTVMSALSGT